MNGGTVVKVTGEFQKVPYYTKPLETPIGVTKGLKVYKNVMNSCVIYLN